MGVVVAGVALPAFLLRRISATRDVVPVVSVGDEVPIGITLNNESRGRKGPLAGIDALLGEKTFVIQQIAPFAATSIVLGARAARRGAFQSAELRLETAAPFGIGKAVRVLEVESPIVVHPKWVPIPSFPLLESASTPNETLHERPRRGHGTDFYGLREYRPGDSLRRIHWPSSARAGGLLVREYEEHIGSRMSIIIEGSVFGPEPETSFEVAASCAASLVMYSLDAGHPVQLFSASGGHVAHLFEPGKAEALDWLARLDPEEGEGLMRLTRFACAEIYRRSTNVLIFPSGTRVAEEALDAVAALQEIGTRVIALVISARSFAAGGEVLSERAEDDFIDRLAGTRAIVYSIEKERELAECLREPLPV